MNNLILIGNGFDKHCGLNTAYLDYFDYLFNNSFWKQSKPDLKREEVKDWRQNILIFITDPKLISEPKKDQIKQWLENNYFNILFLSQLRFNDLNWLDVEFELHNYLKQCNECSNDWFMSMMFDNISTSLYADEFAYGIIHIPRQERPFFSFLKEILSELIKEKSKLDDWIIKSLNIFEKNFYAYINDILDNDKSKAALYYDLALKTLNKLSIISNSGQNRNYLIDFNYTFPFKDNKLPIGWNYDNICNVHGGGYEGKDVIIGIDDMSIDSDKKEKKEYYDSYKFSKTYRRLKQPFTRFVLPTKSEQLTIIFYGLSLSENDYCYYQGIFDKYDVYNNKNVSIVFAYSTGFENYEAAYKMLKSYGKTLDNKDHGKNLITLLGLEQRIKFVDIDKM